jgi:hypothetical protein
MEEDDPSLRIHAARRFLADQREWMEIDRASTARLIASGLIAIEQSRKLLAQPLPAPIATQTGNVSEIVPVTSD